MVVKKVVAMVIVVIAIATTLYTSKYCQIIDSRYALNLIDINIIDEGINIEKVFDSNENFYGGYTDDGIYLGTLNNNLKIYFWSINDQSLYESYISDNSVSFVQMEPCNNGAILMECFFKNALLYFEIRISTNGSNFTKVYEDKCQRIPYIYITDKDILINYDYKTQKNYKSVLNALDIETFQVTEIDSVIYNINERGLYKGNKIVYAGGDDNVICYQMLSMNDEIAENAGSIALVKVDRKNKEKKAYSVDKLSLHVTGTSNIILLSEYDYEKPLEKSGKIYSVDNQSLNICKTINEVSSGIDIMNSKIISNNVILFITPKQYFIYDSVKNVYFNDRFEDNDKNTSNVKITQEGISYLEYTDNNTILHKKIIYPGGK